MSLVPVSRSLTAAYLAQLVPPQDDVGAQTFDRYDWQAAMAARDGLGLYLARLRESTPPKLDDGAIICEHHEDWIVTNGGNAELVSAKHRETSEGPYSTCKKMSDNAGLRHLFHRWVALSERLSCRVVTTAGVANDGAELDALGRRLSATAGIAAPSQISDDDRALIERFAVALLSKPEALPNGGPPPTKGQPTDGQLQQVQRFLAILTMEHSQPARQYIEPMAPTGYMQPVLVQLGVTADVEAIAVAAWSALHGLFRERMRSKGPTVEGHLATIFAASATSAAAAASTTLPLASRTVSLRDIARTIGIARTSPLGFTPLPEPVVVNKLGRKMARGDCHSNIILAADELRLAYQRFWRDRTAMNPAAIAERQKLEQRVLRVAADVTSKVRQKDQAWGTPFWDELSASLSRLPATARPSGVDDELLIGAATHLSNQCKIWFSETFDVRAGSESSPPPPAGGDR